MQIKDTKRNIQKAYEYKKNFDYSIRLAELEPLIDGSVIYGLKDCDLLVAEQMFKDFVTKKIHLSDEEYFHLFSPIEQISGFDFMNNPFLRDISLHDISTSDIVLCKSIYKANEFAILDEPVQDKTLLRRYSVGIFDCPASTYVLKNKDFVWMSVCPMEINTAQKAIQNASGNVLVLGGGLGYYPYMVSLKPEVNSVTIVENNPIIMDILDTFIIPQFSNKKVHIIHDDAYSFLNSISSDEYDSVFIDIWQDNVQGLEDYKKFVKFESKYPHLKFDYWLENSILDSIIVNIYQYFSAKLGTEEYQKYFAMIAPDLWNHLESVHDVINRPEQMDYYLTRPYAKNLLKKM